MPPLNAADMQRIRMSLPYFKQFGWDAEVVTIDPKFTDIVRDELLVQSVPADIKIHTIKAFDKSWTSKIGLGSLALRSLLFYRKKVSRLLKESHFDLIYFSTTEFAVSTLGAYWKKRFGIPYIIDMQDPWHSDYYLDKPKEQRPPKYWFSYRLNKYLEPIAMKSVGGLISVSENYINDLKARYPEIKDIPSATITFGAFTPDLQIAATNSKQFTSLLDPEFINIVYVGRGGNDMRRSITPLFKALRDGLGKEPEIFNKIKVYFIGTSYAPKGQSKPTILPLAEEVGVANSVVEITDRISYYHTLTTLQQADALFIPGSDDPRYTASKIFPYLLAQKPSLAIFNSQSSAISILAEYGAKYVYSYNATAQLEAKVYDFLKEAITGDKKECKYNPDAIKKYSAEIMAKQQSELFNKVLDGKV
ncbi:MAG: hypothetical protein ACHQHN_18505 [Sphingobacteriales bacterium]